MTNHQRKTDPYRTGNLECARIIAVDPERYPGVMQTWAAIVLGPIEAGKDI